MEGICLKNNEEKILHKRIYLDIHKEINFKKKQTEKLFKIIKQ